MRFLVRLLASLVVLTSVSSLAGCVGGKALAETPMSTSTRPTATPSPLLPSAALLWKTAQASLAAATSLHMTARLTEATGVTGHEMIGTRDGSNSKQITTASSGTGEILVVGDHMYFKGDTGFLKAQSFPDTVIQRLGGRYLSIPLSKVSGSFTPKDLSIGSWLDQVQPLDIDLTSAALTVEKAEISGTPVYLLTDKSTTEQAQVWVTADGKANVVKLFVQDAGTPSPTGPQALEMTFSEWSSVAPFTAPPANQVLAA